MHLLTCDDLRSLWLRSNLHANQSKFFTVWPPNPSQHKLSDGAFCWQATLSGKPDPPSAYSFLENK